MSNEELVEIILEEGPLSAAELAEMSYPVRVTYLALMLSWALEYGLEAMAAQRETLRPMVLRGLEGVAQFIEDYWKQQAAREEGADDLEVGRERVRSTGV